MKLVKASFKDISGSRYSHEMAGFGSAQATVKEFAESDMEVALVENPAWGKNTNGASILSAAIKRLKIAGVVAITHNGKTYLVKTDKV